MHGLHTGTLLGDFRLDRPLDVARGFVTYEATQLSLDRRATVRLPDPAAPPDPDVLERFLSAARAQATLRHPGVVEVFAAGDCEHGPWVATALVPTRTLRDLLEHERVGPAGCLSLLEQVARALDAAHAAGLAHGALSAGTVLIGDGDRALITDLRRMSDGGTPSPDDDRKALAALARDLLGSAAPRAAAPAASAQDVMTAAVRPPRRSHRVVLAAAGVAAAAAAGGLVLAGTDDGASGAPAGLPAPSVMAGASAVGSDLSAGPTRAVSCDGSPPDPSRPICTVLQTRLAGRPVAARADGVIRRWAVRGARGEVALVVARMGSAGAVLVARSQAEVLADERPRAFRTELPVRRGDRIGVELAPGAAIGVREPEGGARTQRWLGLLRSTDAVRPEGPGGAELESELLLRADLVRGAAVRGPRRLVGSAAAGAAAGRIIRRAHVLAAGDEVVLVAVGGGVALDLFGDGRRFARIGVPGADAGGAPEGLRVTRLSGAVLVTWRNPDGRSIVHEYRVRSRTLRFAY